MTEDPGWRPVLRHLPFAVMPFLATWASKRRQLDGLTSLRLVYLSFVFPLALLLSLQQRLDRTGGDGGFTERWSLLVLVALAVTSYGYLVVLIRRARADVTSSGVAALNYRTLAFLVLAFAIAIVLFGFLFAFLTGSIVPVYVGLALAVPGLYLAAPTSANLARHQRPLAPSVDLIGGLLALHLGGSGSAAL